MTLEMILERSGIIKRIYVDRQDYEHAAFARGIEKETHKEMCEIIKSDKSILTRKVLVEKYKSFNAETFTETILDELLEALKKETYNSELTLLQFKQKYHIT